jgi:hypothetical protein
MLAGENGLRAKHVVTAMRAFRLRLSSRETLYRDRRSRFKSGAMLMECG